MDVLNMDLQQRLSIAVSNAAKILPKDVGDQLLAMLTYQALGTVATVVGIWAGS